MIISAGTLFFLLAVHNADFGDLLASPVSGWAVVRPFGSENEFSLNRQAR
jgi:hypothetical protein